MVSFDPARGQRLDGFNVVATPDHPFGSMFAERALIAARNLGATTVAIIPFLWQASPSSPDIKSGSDMSDDALRARRIALPWRCFAGVRRSSPKVACGR
jgi:hypothetical protein